jgi:hypothetical protein
MLYLKRISIVVLALVLVGPLSTFADSSDLSILTPALQGHVSSTTAALPASSVYVYQLADFSLRKVITDAEGNFLFDRLPAGLYKIIAYKAGFVPAVALLTRATAEARQYLEMQLTREQAAEAIGAGFWSVRQRIPSDVLRDIERQEFEAAHRPGVSLDANTQLAQFQAEMQAVAGLDEHRELGPAQLTGGRLRVLGKMRGVRVGLSGDFVELQATPANAIGTSESSSKSQAVALDVGHRENSDVQLTSMSNRLVKPGRYGDAAVVDFERHQLSWSQNVGQKGRSDFSAQYTEESNYYRQGPMQASGLPTASRSWGLEGSYTTSLTDRSTLEAGFSYRQRESDYDELQQASGHYSLLPEEIMDFFGRSGLQVNPTVLVEVGLYSTLRDGSLSLAPSGGLVIKLGESWRAYTTASLQAHEQEVDEVRRDFTPAFFDDSASCEQADQHCYQLLLEHSSGDRNSLSFGAIHRQLTDTLRLYFNEDFFNHLESLYLVQGDSLPELQFAMTRQITPRILTRLASNLAAGGGGILNASNDTSYENQVRYLVTSLDTRFNQTSTGVFIAFHHLAQELNPLRSSPGDVSEMELERLQLMLTQDLDLLERLPSDWVLKVNMELSRGATALDSSLDPEELRKRVTGGISVRF